MATIITQQVRAVGPESTRIQCPSCNAEINTNLKQEPTTKTHIMAGLLCLCGLWCFVCLPYCVESCQNTNHYCPKCQAFIGTYKS